MQQLIGKVSLCYVHASTPVCHWFLLLCSVDVASDSSFISYYNVIRDISSFSILPFICLSHVGDTACGETERRRHQTNIHWVNKWRATFNHERARSVSSHRVSHENHSNRHRYCCSLSFTCFWTQLKWSPDLHLCFMLKHNGRQKRIPVKLFNVTFKEKFGHINQQ